MTWTIGDHDMHHDTMVLANHNHQQGCQSLLLVTSTASSHSGATHTWNWIRYILLSRIGPFCSTVHLSYSSAHACPYKLPYTQLSWHKIAALGRTLTLLPKMEPHISLHMQLYFYLPGTNLVAEAKPLATVGLFTCWLKFSRGPLPVTMACSTQPLNKPPGSSMAQPVPSVACSTGWLSACTSCFPC